MFFFLVLGYFNVLLSVYSKDMYANFFLEWFISYFVAPEHNTFALPNVA